MFQKLCGFKNNFSQRGGYKNFIIFHGKLFVSQYRNISWRNPSVFQKVSGFYKISKYWGGGRGSITVSKFSSENLRHSNGTSRRGTLLCLRKCQCRRNVSSRRDALIIPVVLFCVIMPKNFVKEPFYVSEKFRFEKQLESERRV